AADHDDLLHRPARPDRAVLVRIRQPGRLQRLLRLDDGELPGVHLEPVPAHARPQRRALGVDHARMRGDRVHLRVLHQPPEPEGPATAARRRDRAVLDELHRPHLFLGRPAPEPGAGRPARARTRPARAHRHPVHTVVDRDRHPLLVPAAHDPADLRLARADRPGPVRRRGGPGRDPMAAVPPRRAADGSAGADRRHHHRRRAGPRRVRDPRDPGRRKDAHGRQHPRRPVPPDRQLSVRLGAGRQHHGRADGAALHAAPGPTRGGRAVNVRRHPFAAGVSLLVLLFMWLPLIVVAVNSFNQQTIMAGWGGFTTHWYSLALHDQNVRTGLQTTLYIAVASALLSLAIAVTGALWWRQASPKARAVYDGLIYARIILPEVVSATALFFLFLKIHFTLGLTAIVIGHTVWNSAYAAIIVQARMAGLDPALEEAAADLGATPWRTFRRVTFAALLPAIIAAGLLAFTFSFDDVVTSVFLQGASNTPLPVVILGMIRFRITPEINAIGLLVMLFTVTLMSIAVLIYATAGSLGRSGRRGNMLDIYRGR